jgi:hypothetical protein
MRLLRLLLVLSFVGVVGWLVVLSVSVQSTDEAVQITIDKHKLRQAGHDLEAKGRLAAGRFGEALQQAGRKLDDQHEASDRR